MKTREKNNFDAIRLIAALGVMFSHAEHYYFPGKPLFSYINKYSSLGDFCLLIFFSISGYLISQSRIIVGKRSRYITNRCLRIFPALIANILFCGLILGPLLSKDTIGSYFSSTELYKFLLSIFLFPLNLLLPGVFRSHPDGGSVNGPIYTLTIEFVAYIFIFLASSHKKMLTIQVFITFCALYWILVNRPPTDLDYISVKYNGIELFYLPFKISVQAFVAFLTGVLLQLSAKKFSTSAWLPTIAVITFVLSCNSVWFLAVQAITIPIVFTYIGLTTWRLSSPLSYIGDLSYGVYIYHYPLQKAVYDVYGKQVNLYVLFFVSVVTTLAFAALSYHLIEKYALKLKAKSSNQF